jgi:hypothetical protein
VFSGNQHCLMTYFSSTALKGLYESTDIVRTGDVAVGIRTGRPLNMCTKRYPSPSSRFRCHVIKLKI